MFFILLSQVMKKLLLVTICISCCIIGIAQTIINPVFDRMDVPAFRVEKVVKSLDTTYVHCSYRADEHSWANISKDTYIEDQATGMRFPILDVTGIPFSPQKRSFDNDTIVQVLLYFPGINSEKINIIENDDHESFNIYGINLKRSFDYMYTDEDIEFFYNNAMKYEESKQWKEAINYSIKQHKASEFVYGIRSKESAWPMYSLTVQYFGTGEYKKGIEAGEKVIKILNEYPQDSLVIDVIARTYGNLSTYYSRIKNDELASRYREKSIYYRRMKPEIGAVNYEEYLQLSARNSYYDADYPKALMYGKELADIYQKAYEDNKYEYGCSYSIALSNLSEYYRIMGQYEDAVISSKKALEIIDNNYCDNIDTKFLAYCNLAGALASVGKTDEAIDYLRKVLHSEDDKGSSNRLILNSRMFLADLLFSIKKDTVNSIKEYEIVLKELENSIKSDNRMYSEYIEILQKLHKAYRGRNATLSIFYLKQAINYIKKTKGENSVAYANIILQLINVDYIETLKNKSDLDSLMLLLRNSSDIIKRHMINSQFSMSKSEREQYWHNYKYYFTWTIPTICGSLILDEGHSLAYDIALFYKGMLLSSEREFKEVVMSSKDSTLINMYNDYTQDLTSLEKHYALNTPPINIDSLKRKIKENEYMLAQKVSGYNRLYKGTNFTWQEVRDNLKAGDVAIEIVSYNTYDGSNTYYDAYIINDKSQSPRLRFLFDEKSYKEYSKGDSIDYYLSSWIWGTLYEEIKDARNIYISPSGLLNKIGIEYLPISGGRYINEIFNIFRLSSTRELCLSNYNHSMDDVYLYGGLDYENMNIKKQYSQTDSTRLTRSIVDSIAKRGGFESLVGSKEEIEQVKKVISKRGINCHIYTGKEGTETSLADLSGREINVLHLSTHGMFVPLEDSVYQEKKYSFVIMNDSAIIDKEDQALTRSFLVMSGGNRILQKNGNIEIDDGILTALEVSHLDFSNLDLVVLSACETALGTIDSEGVYGLQRGFKKAGAHAILMSLNKVDDDATKTLMVEFYRNLVSGMTKHQSLKDAQSHLRQIDNGKYDKPEYWASFILLDGLN